MALNARTGEVEWDVAVGDWTIGQHYSGGPMVIKGRVVAGMSGCYHLNTRCWVSAHDADTGVEVWRTYTIPGPGEFGYDSWGDVPDEDRRGGSAWNSPSFDPALNLIFTGVGVPIPWGSVQRGTGDGDVLYTNSTLALDADTGEIAWYFQHIPNDEWDLDHPYARLVVETEVSPGRRRVAERLDRAGETAQDRDRNTRQDRHRVGPRRRHRAPSCGPSPPTRRTSWRTSTPRAAGSS